jgi:hypothetical protein
MSAIVQFNYARWIARYPEFSQVQQPTAQEYFGEATLYLRNDGTGPVRDAETQLRLLNMLTAHIAALIAYRTVHYLPNKKPVVGAGPWWGGVGGFGRWPR